MIESLSYSAPELCTCWNQSMPCGFKMYLLEPDYALWLQNVLVGTSLCHVALKRMCGSSQKSAHCLSSFLFVSFYVI